MSVCWCVKQPVYWISRSKYGKLDYGVLLLLMSVWPVHVDDILNLAWLDAWNCSCNVVLVWQLERLLHSFLAGSVKVCEPPS